MDGGDSELGVEAYAAILAAITDPRADRAATLAMHGLDEERWDQIDSIWQSRLSRAEEEHTGDEENVVSPLLARFAEAFARAQRAHAEGLVSFERYLEITRVLRRGGALKDELERLSITVPEYLKAHEHWMRIMATDAALAARFMRAIG